MPEYQPGDLRRIVTSVQRQGLARTRRSMTQLTLAIERQAKINASSGAHKLGTPTPATPGSGPARISGTLVRSITHTPVKGTAATGYTASVGVARGFTPRYSDTPANEYGGYLERVHNYPFLSTAVRFGRTVVAPQVFEREFRGSWT